MSSRTPSVAAPPERAAREEGARARLEAIARVLDSRWRVPAPAPASGSGRTPR
jgi:hypothetical protein